MNTFQVLLAVLIWQREHVALPFQITEWDGTKETVLVVPYTRILWDTKGRIPGIATRVTPNTLVIQYEDGMTHRIPWETFLGMVGFDFPMEAAA